ncbi:MULTISPECIES: ACP S-malonyltransferase [unclassified Kribbella]|uniref:ACP S-malonyltransferase n=1 Tax=unclassified Kribbella TaxID=2644121 RepID=UPI0033CE3BF3
MRDGAGDSARGTAFVFPGQGSQRPAMGRELSRCGEQARALIDRSEELSGVPVGELMTHADAATLADPEAAQLTIFVWSSVLTAELATAGFRPVAVAGHSLGEYSALVAAGCLSWESALVLVARRGRAMADAARRQPGAMAAIVGLSTDQITELCQQRADGAGVVVLANINAARQVVISGTSAQVEEVADAARSAGALRVKRLPVGGAYHSPLMAEAERELAPLIAAADLRPPQVPFVSSVTGTVVDDIERYRQLLATQITHPVRWSDTVETLGRTGAGIFVEVGPGRVLTGLGRNMLRAAEHLAGIEALGTPVRAVAAGQGS